MKKPEPVVVSEVCSLCGLAWGRHGDKPTAEKCIELLKADLATRPYVPTITWKEPPQWWQQPVVSYGMSTGNSTSLTLITGDDEPPEAVAV